MQIDKISYSNPDHWLGCVEGCGGFMGGGRLTVCPFGTTESASLLCPEFYQDWQILLVECLPLNKSLCSLGHRPWLSSQAALGTARQRWIFQVQTVKIHTKALFQSTS